MNYVKCPCQGCKDRAVGCHSNCAKYDEWKRKENKIKKQIKEDNEYLSFEISVRGKRKERREKKERK